jgi:hypothetical protein
MKPELQCHQNGKLSCHKFFPVQTERVLGFLEQRLETISFDVVQLRRQYQTCASTQLSVLFVDQSSQYQFFKIHVRLSYGHQINVTFGLGDFAHLALQTEKKSSGRRLGRRRCRSPSQLAERQLHVRELLPELVVDLPLQVGGPHVIDHRRHVRREGQQSPVFSGDQFRIVQ